MSMRLRSTTLLGGAVLATAACWDNPSSPSELGFAEVQGVLQADCAACHSSLGAHLNLLNTFQTTMDSAALVTSGFIDPADPYRSLLIRKARAVIPHGGGAIGSFDSKDEWRVAEWIRRQPNRFAYRLNAGRIAASQAPAIDGDPGDPVWATAGPITVPINGGWADATEVTMRAAHDGVYVYFVLQWVDDEVSERRQPWIKQLDGSWATAAAKPRPHDGYTWGANWTAEGSDYMYEDKVAVMWNTYGASTVAGFDNGGCAVTCHDPAMNNRPGKSYFYSDENRAAKKYTNAPSEIADIWHWKMVRMNQHFKLDDQWVGHWEPYTGDPHNGGRGSDAGTGGYAANPATNGSPTYRHPSSLTAPPFFILESEKQLVTAAELAALPVGTMLPNMVTSGPTGARADVDARGQHDGSKWTLEIRRKLATGDPKDVQFDDLAREYVFGVAVFDNAQIEHSYSSTPLKLVFQR